ncbi:maestro heat-like repeat-containing protein family member 2B [Athene cunicularia]|uniref:maestro heat-like repeat-containing protein family member 2B n=1 Tax=Athene cunicularia TaxID=194338 RepID=UPI000EF745AE|nr:maestro heat-like repeat-containing protein family member 2B [Athene cunicularia]
MRAAQGVTCEVKMAASDVLVALARSHFHFVMAELQSHLKSTGKAPDEVVLLTLGKMAHSYALQCIPFARMTMLALHAMLSRVGSGQLLCTICSVLEQWSKGINKYLCNRERCPFPGKGVAQFCEAIYPVFQYVVSNCLERKEEEDKQAVLRAVAAMMGVLLREEQHRELAWEQLPWLLHKYHRVLDNSWQVRCCAGHGVAAGVGLCECHEALGRCGVPGGSLCYVLEVLEGVPTPIPQDTALAISTALHRQIVDVTPEPGPEHQAVLTRCMVLLARMCPEETAMFLHSLLCGGTEADRTAALGLLGALAHSDAQLLAPQFLTSRLLLVAAASSGNSKCVVAALQLLQTLPDRIHRALGAAWVTEIPLLLQYLEGRRESSLDSAEWEHRVLKFLQASLEPIEDQTWTVGLSQALSQQLVSSASGSWEKLFLYKALGTTLAACRDLRHVQGQVLRFLQETNPMELSEAQGMVSVVSHAAESHFDLVLDTVTTFSADLIRDGFCKTSTGWKVQRWQKMENAQAICAALMRTYSGVALHAPKEQLLRRVDKEILGNILQLSRAEQRDSPLKLALVESITEVSCAIQAVGKCESFELSLKQEAMQTLLDWIKGEPRDSVDFGVFHVLEELSKLRPPLSREENCNLLSVCCQSALSYPCEEQKEKGREGARAAENVQMLHRRNMEDLGHLIETLLETEATSVCLDDVVLVLKGWLTSAKEWERERALWVCGHVLGTCKERCELQISPDCRMPGTFEGGWH